MCSDHLGKSVYAYTSKYYLVASFLVVSSTYNLSVWNKIIFEGDALNHERIYLETLH